MKVTIYARGKTDSQADMEALADDLIRIALCVRRMHTGKAGNEQEIISDFFVEDEKKEEKKVREECSLRAFVQTMMDWKADLPLPPPSFLAPNGRRVHWQIPDASNPDLVQLTISASEEEKLSIGLAVSSVTVSFLRGAIFSEKRLQWIAHALGFQGRDAAHILGTVEEEGAWNA